MRRISFVLALAMLLTGCGQPAIQVVTPTQPTTVATTVPETTLSETTTPETTVPETTIPETTEPLPEDGQRYVLNLNTMKFHFPSCGSAKRIKETNRKDMVATREQLISQGYDPCGNCHP